MDWGRGKCAATIAFAAAATIAFAAAATIAFAAAVVAAAAATCVHPSSTTAPPSNTPLHPPRTHSPGDRFHRTMAESGYIVPSMPVDRVTISRCGGTPSGMGVQEKDLVIQRLQNEITMLQSARGGVSARGGYSAAGRSTARGGAPSTSRGATPVRENSVFGAAAGVQLNLTNAMAPGSSGSQRQSQQFSARGGYSARGGSSSRGGYSARQEVPAYQPVVPMLHLQQPPRTPMQKREAQQMRADIASVRGL
jgi:hypothetical protein